MSIATEISRIQTNRNTIRAKLVELGMATNTDNLDRLASAIEGLVNQGAVSVEVVEGTTYTIPAGYHNGSGTVKAISDVTGDLENYKTQTKAVTPTKRQQNVTPDSGYYALSAVTVNAIPDAYQDVTSVTATAENVLTGKIFVTKDGKVITGTMVNNGTVNKTLDVTTVSYTIPKGYHSGTGTVSISLEKITISPNKSGETITSTAGKVFSEITVLPIPDEYQDVSEVTATADKVLIGSVFVDSAGAKVAGTMGHLTDFEYSLFDDSYDSDDGTQVIMDIEKGYHDGTTKVVADLDHRVVTPSKSRQSVTANLAFLSEVEVEAIPDAYQDVTPVTAGPADVLEGAKFVNSSGEVVTGIIPIHGDIEYNFEDGGIESDTGDKVIFAIAEGYHNGSTSVAIPIEEDVVITPTKSTQTVAADISIRGVIVNPIPTEYITTTDANAVASEILYNKTAYVNGVKVTGSMANNGDVTDTIDGLTKTSVTIPTGYTTGGTISLTSDIEDALAAI